MGAMDHVGICIFLITLCSTGTQTWATPLFGVTGDSITLPGIRFSDPPAKSLQWVHNKTVIGTWDRGGSPETLHPDVIMDNTTFDLTLSNLHPNSNGLYQLDVDHSLSVTYELTVLDAVGEPTIVHSCNSSMCVLNCAALGSRPQFIWTDGKGGGVSGPEWVVQRSEHLEKVYTCNATNPVGWETKSISEREFPVVIFRAVNSSVEFSPQEQLNRTTVKSVTWRHNQDFAAQWFEEEGQPVYYRIFENFSELNMERWSLKIPNLQKSFSGTYSAEINNKDPSKGEILVVLDPVSKPNVTQVCNTTSCTLTCVAEQGDDTEYAWSDSRGNMEKGQKWTVQRPKQEDASFTCNVSNAVSWETAVQVITVEQIPMGWLIGIVVGGVAAAVVVVLFCICCCKKREDGVDVLTETAQQEREAPESEPLNSEVENGQCPAAEDVTAAETSSPCL